MHVSPDLIEEKRLRTGAKNDLVSRLKLKVKRAFRPKLACSETPFNPQFDSLTINQKLLAIGYANQDGKMLAEWVKNQQQSDACSGMAGSYFLGTIHALNTNSKYIPLSAKSIYSLIYYPQGGTTDGALQKQLENVGVMTEAMVPSVDAQGNCTEAFMRDKTWDSTPDAIIMSQYANLTLVTVQNDINAIAEAIRDYGGVIVHLNSDFYQTANWLSANPQRTPTSPDGHFLFFYNAQMVNGVLTIYAAESWGVSAGDQGTQYFTENTFIGSPDIVDVFTFVPTYVNHPTLPGQQVPNPMIIPWQTRLVNYFTALFSGWLN